MTWQKAPPRVKQYEGTTAGVPSVPYAALRIADTRARLVIPLPKEQPKRSEAYRRWVASRPCDHCKRAGPTQCAHSDEGKGLSLKSSDETCFSLCADGPGRQGCHSLIGASGAFTREQRRQLESIYGARTRLDALANGHWPKAWN